jgi:hypothetical protein
MVPSGRSAMICTVQPIAEPSQHRFGERGDTRRAPRLGDEPRLVGKSRGRVVHARTAVNSCNMRPASEPPGLS